MSFDLRPELTRAAAGQPLRMDSNSLLPHHDWPCVALPVPPPAPPPPVPPPVPPAAGAGRGFPEPVAPVLPRLPRPPHPLRCVAPPRPVVVRPVVPAPAPPPPVVRHPQATLPPKPTPSQIHATTAVPVAPAITAAAVPAPPAAPEAAFVFVAVTLPALVAAGAGYVSHAFGRHR